ncbi:MAG: DUF2341 domain-containing protein, partial [candidate division SR1 bacterium]|nr:DUF2341 domain-containing protein [candidate division SR1 bacterium]
MFFPKKNLHKKNVINKIKSIFSGKISNRKLENIYIKNIRFILMLVSFFFVLGLFFTVGFQILQNNFFKSFASSGSVEFAQNISSKLESVRPDIIIKASQTNTNDVSINYAVTGGTAKSGSDFSGNTSGVVTIKAGESQALLPLIVIDNKIAQDNRTIQITLSSPSVGMTLGGITVHTYTILDDDIESNLQTYDSETLPVTSGLSMRMDAGTVATTGSNVTSWTDQSGSYNDAVQNTVPNQPILVNNAINGKPAVRFDGINDSLLTTNNIIPANSNYSIFTIDKRNAAPNALWPIVANVTSFNTNQALHFGYQNNTTFRFAQFGQNVDATVDGYIPNNASLSSGTFDSTVGHKLYRNGLLLASDAALTGLTNTDKIAIGNWNNSSFYYGDIAEILIYNRALSANEQKQVECYLSAKYGTGAVGCSAKLKLHFDASSGTGQTVDGASVSTWEDKSGNGNNAVQTISANQPTFQSGGINGKPSVRFNGAANTIIGTQNNLILNSSFTNYIVSKISGNGLYYEHSTDSNSNPDSSYLYSTSDYSSFVKRSGQSSAKVIGTNWGSNNTPQIINQTYAGNNTDHNLYLNGTSQTLTNPIASNVTGSASAPFFIGGRSTNTFSITGDISEVITLGNNVASTQRTIIDNYLSAKYAISISNSKYSLASGANNKLIGIGKEDDLTISQSGGSQGLTISDPTNTLDTGEYVMAAHDGGNNTLSTTDIPAGVSTRWNRIWGIGKTSVNGINATLSFDLSQYSLGIPGVTSNYKLLYRNGTSGAFTALATTSTTITNGDRVSFAVSDTNLQAGYYTLGSADTTASPLTILSTPSGFTVSKQANETAVNLSWSAVTGATGYKIEYSNDRFSSNISSIYIAGLSASITNLTTGPYSFRITAYNTLQNSIASQAQDIAFAPKISAVTPNTGATVGGYNITLTGINLDTRENLKITLNNPGSAITNYEDVSVIDTATLISQGKMRPDCGDLRVLDSASINAPYWIESGCNTTKTLVWYKLATLPAGLSDIFITFNNPGFASQSSITNLSFGALFNPATNKLWVKANAGTSTTTNGGIVSKWQDQSGNGNDLNIQGGFSGATYQNSGINNQPTLQFNGSNSYSFTNRVSDIRSVYIVWKETAPGGGAGSFLLGDTGSYDFHRSGDGAYFANGIASGNITSGIFRINGSAASTISTVPIYNQPLMFSLITTGNVGANTFDKDRGFHGPLIGLTSEIVIFNTPLDTSDNAKIENYLGKKYRILSNIPSQSSASLTIPLKVTIGGNNATTSVIGGAKNSFLVNVPAGSTGPKNIVVTDNNNQTDTLVNGFTYAAPTISSVSPNSGSTVGGDTVTISGTNFASDGYKKVISITNPDINAITNYEGSITLDTASLISAGKLRGDCGDLRVKDSDGTTNLSYYLEKGSCNNPSSILWFKKPNLPTGVSTVTLSYGNSINFSQSNINNFSFGPIISGANNKLWVSANTANGQTSDNGSISNLTDKSGLGNNALQASSTRQPILKTNALNGQPVIRFDGVNDGMSAPLPLSGNTNFTLFSVTNHLNFPSNYGPSPVSWGPDSTTGFFAGPYYYPPQGGSKFISAWGSASGASFSTQDAFAGQAKLSSSVYNGSTNIMYLNGQAGTTGTKSDSNFTTGTFDLGYTSIVSGGGNYFNGDIAEVLLFNSALSNTDRQTVENYLNTKYRLFNPSNLPSISTGSEFNGITVLFGNTPATNLTVVNTTTVTAVVPSHTAGAVNVVFSNSSGDSATLTNGFTYLAPTISSVSPNSSSTLGGDTVTINGANFASAGYKKSISINNPLNTSISDYEGSIKIDTASLIAANKLRSDCGDLRVLDSDETTNLSYWIDGDCNLPNTIVWFKKPTLNAGNNTIYLNYGKLANTSQSNISNFSFGSLLTGTNNKLWLSANTGVDVTTDGGQVSLWKDRSSNFNNASRSTSINKPILKNNTLNGQPVVRFDGSDDSLDVANPSQFNISNPSIFIVGKSNVGGGTFIGKNDVNQGGGSRRKLQVVCDRFYSGSDGNVLNFPCNLGQFQLKTIIGNSGTDHLVGTNGNLQSFSTALDYTSYNGQPLRLGRPFEVSAEWLNGDIAETIIFNTALSTPDRLSIEKYLNTKYQLFNTSTLPTITSNEETKDVKVYFGTTLASNTTLINSTSVSVKVPSHTAGSVNVKFVNSSGDEGVLTNGFTYAGPSITSVSPNVGPVTGGTDVTITGTNFSSVGYNKTIDITNPAASAITNYEGSFKLDTASLITAGKMKSDCGDIRLKDSDESTDLVYYFDNTTCNTATTIVWFKKPTLSVGQNKIYFSYGNAALTSQSNIANFSFGSVLASATNKLWLSANNIPDQSVEVRPGFENLVGVTIDGGNISKTGGSDGSWDAGFTTTNAISKGKGYVSAKIPQQLTGRTNMMIGLSNGNTDSNYTDIDFAIYIAANGSLQVYQGGGYAGGYGSVVPGDRVSVELLNNKVFYKKNGMAFYQSGNTPTSLNLIADASIWGIGDTFEDIKFCDGTCSSSSIGTWNDRTSNFNNVTQASAAYSPVFLKDQLNGQPIIRFDGIDDYINTTTQLGANNFTAFYVAKPNSSTPLPAENLSSADTTARQYLSFPENPGNSDSGSGIAFGTNGISVHEHAPSYLTAPAVTTSNNGNNFSSLSYSYTDKTARIDLNGQIVRNGLTSTRTNIYAPKTFGGGGGGYGYFNGDVAEVMVFDTSLSSQDRQSIESYLNAKYQLYSISNSPILNIGTESLNFSVLFDTVKATKIVLVNSTTITATTPSHIPGTANITFNNTNGDSAVLTNGFTYVAPIITSVTPNSGPSAGGNQITIDGNYFPFGGGGGVYNRKIVLNNGTQTSVIDYQTSLNIDTSQLISQGKMRSDCGDIRFSDSQNDNNIPYWIETGCNTSSTKIWIKVPSLNTGNNEIYFSYGDLNSASASNPDNVFIRKISGLVSSFTMDENVSSAAQDTQNTNSVTGGTNTTVTPGKFGNARGFNGSNSSLTRASVNLPTGSNMSTVAWIKPTGYNDASYNGIANWGGRGCSGISFLMSIQSSGRPSMATYCNDYVPGSAPAATLNTWNHEAVTMSGTNVSLYMNNSVSSGTIGSSNVQSVNLTIGSTDYPSGRVFSGSIDELQIYNRALSASEISDLYNNYGYSSTSNPGQTFVTKVPLDQLTTTILDEYSQTIVKIGNVNATSVQFISPTKVKVTIPANPLGTYNIKMTVPGNIDSNTNVTYNYVAPTVTSVSPNAGPNSGGAFVTVSGTNFASLNYSFIPITISNPNATALVDYQTKFVVNTSSLISSNKLASDCSNLRIRNTDNGDLPYWIESGCNTDKTIIWTKIPNIDAGSFVKLNLFYGLANLTSQSNGNNVFEFFDDFEGNTIDTNKWDAIGNTWTQSGGVLQVPLTGSAGVPYSHFISKTFATSNAVIETINTPLSVGSSQGKGVSFRYTDTNNQYTGFLEAYNTNINELVKRVGGTFSNISATPTNGGVVANTSYRQIVSFNGSSLSNSVTKLDSNQTTTTTANDSSFSSGKVGFSVDRDETATGVKFDFILVRKFSAIEPTVTIGSQIKAIDVSFANNTVVGAFIDDHTVTAYTPAGSNTVNVKVTNTDGVSGTGNNLYNYGVSAVPNQVTDLRGVASEGDTQNLVWSTPNSNGSPITDYIIKYSQNNFATETIFNDGMSSNNFAAVSGLIPGQSYKFKVIAVNSVGNSVDSNIFSVSKLDCDTDIGGANLIISTNQTLSGSYCNINEFRVNGGVTASLDNTPGTGSTGGKVVKIYAQSANILGTIDGNTKGYIGTIVAGQGPGAGNSNGSCYAAVSGGSYGGKGGQSGYNAANTYGSITQPTDLGSAGGGSCGYAGGNGGGAIKLAVTGTLTNNGNISANGGVPNYYPSGGSGGSIWLQATTLAGTGTISANGGNHGGAGNSGGGGGRIALYYATKTFSGTVSNTGGSGSSPGGAGTTYEKNIADVANLNGSLLISN